MKKHMVIPAVRTFKELERSLTLPQDTIFLLEGELIHLQSITDSVKRAGKQIFIHLDLIKGIRDDEASLRFLSKIIKIDGVISTRSSTLLTAKKFGLQVIQRAFLIDSRSMQTVIKSANQVNPDFIEILPSFSHPKLEMVKRETGCEVIIGGFIEKKEELPVLYNAGAFAVSTSRIELWS